MSHFDTLKHDITDSIFAECYEPLCLELETTMEPLKLKINKNYDLKYYFKSDWFDDDTTGLSICI